MSAATVGAVTSPRTRDGATVGLGFWLVVGLFLDGYMHNTRGDQLESFLTPWHGVLYSGFLASAVWICRPMLTADGTIRERVARLPRGYGLGALGVIVFAVGGMGDSIWHSLLGIEVDLEALISPPHLVLLIGALLILTTPVRAAWHRRGDAQTLRSFMPALGSVAISMLVVGFFFMYASGLYDHRSLALFDEFVRGQLGNDRGFIEELRALGVLSRLVTTVILMAPAMLLLRRWQVPNGTFTTLFTVYGAFMLVLDEFRYPEMVAVAFVTGVVADLLVARLQPRSDRPAAAWTVGAAVPAVLWGLHFGTSAATGALGWPFVLWGGTVMFAALTGLVVALLAFPPQPPRLSD